MFLAGFVWTNMAPKCFAIWFYCYWVILATVLIDAQLDGEKCSKEGESGRDCWGILKPVGKRLSRAGSIPCGSYLCERHRFRVLQEDSTRCSCPSSWGHSKAFSNIWQCGKNERGLYTGDEVVQFMQREGKRRVLSPWRAFKKVYQERWDALILNCFHFCTLRLNFHLQLAWKYP